tara:strand:+ start:1223 stop:2074 length:852 start_codon:yes stop_codon:yes gene_type:complete
MNISPVVKWVGGKKRLVPYIKKYGPKKYTNYFEPFIGGGSVVLSLKPNKGVYLNDYNHDLVNLYRYIKKDYKEFIKRLERLKKGYIRSKKKRLFFYKQRYNFNKSPRNKINRAVLYLFINKVSFNGIMSMNKDGILNSSWGGGGVKYPMPGIYVKNNIEQFSKFLRKVKLTNMDYEKALKNAKKGDFVFMDPPYVPDDITLCNVKYLKNKWTIKDFERTFKVFDDLSRRGCYVMFTNSWSETITKRFSNKQKYRLIKIPVNRMVSRNKNTRGIKYEALITNYK